MYFYLAEYETTGFDDMYHAYVIVSSATSIKSAFCLLDHHPLSIHEQGSEIMIPLRYEVLGCA